MFTRHSIILSAALIIFLGAGAQDKKQDANPTPATHSARFGDLLFTIDSVVASKTVPSPQIPGLHLPPKNAQDGTYFLMVNVTGKNIGNHPNCVFIQATAMADFGLMISDTGYMVGIRPPNFKGLSPNEEVKGTYLFSVKDGQKVGELKLSPSNVGSCMGSYDPHVPFVKVHEARISLAEVPTIANQ